ncbi:MAG: ferritin-like domain-containing protein [Acidobacteriota bacterium]|nr:ferritin-like domain-containing protein [Acidobacteriota bacterium]
MKFETNREVLDWYERQPRALTAEFIDGINWREVRNYPLDARLVPVLLYMRDVETLTEVYYEEMRRTPTGKDPVISKFMERWGVEETTHGELLNRFLGEAGIETGDRWQSEIKRSVSRFYTVNSRLITSLTNLVGRKFTATHMTFGAIHELSTAQGYRRLINLANHPVLTHLLKGIIREESAHTQFYFNIARLELRKSPFAQKLSRFVVNKFWSPVGQGAKSVAETNYTIATLFGGSDGLDWVDRNISQRIRRLPGFGNLTKINETTQAINAAYGSAV